MGVIGALLSWIFQWVASFIVMILRFCSGVTLKIVGDMTSLSLSENSDVTEV